MSQGAYRLQARIWRWMLILGPVLVLAFAFWSLWVMRAESATPAPDDLSVETDRVARLVDAYVGRVVGVTSYLALSPDVVDLAAYSSALPANQDDLNREEEKWRNRAGQADDPYTAIEARPVSAFLRSLLAVGGGSYREIFLADKEGRVIAASNRTENFWQKTDSWWPPDLEKMTISCRRLPLECALVSDVEWDPSARVFGFDVVLPVVTAEGRAVGMLKAVVDPAELGALLDFAASSRRFEIALINSKGKQLFALSSGRLFHPEVSDAEVAKRFRRLVPGSEGSWPLGLSRKKGEPAVFARRIASPIQGGWTVAVAAKDEDGDLGAPYVLCCLLTVSLFVIAAGAFAVRPGEPREELKEEAAA